MLTPQDIADKVFERVAFGGYEMPGVDEFLENISENYNSLYKENAILKGKLKVLVEKVEEYRSTEDAMRMALLTAQRMGEELLADANKQRDEILQNVSNEEKTRLAEMERKIAEEELRLTAAVKETGKFVELAQAIMQKHSEFLNKLEKTRRAQVEKSPDEAQLSAPMPEHVEESVPESTTQPREESVEDTANQILGGVLESLKGELNPPPAVNEEASEGYLLYEEEDTDTKLYNIKDEDEFDLPENKFDLENLKFGTNFTNEQ